MEILNFLLKKTKFELQRLWHIETDAGNNHKADKFMQAMRLMCDLDEILNAVEREAVGKQASAEEGSYCMNYDPRTNESHCVQQCDGCKEAEKNPCRAYP